MDASLLLFAGVLIVIALVSGRLERWSVTAPIAFVAAGLAVGLAIDPVVAAEPAKLLAEATLVLLLFHDAAQVKPRQIGREAGLIGRLLFIGLPLTILAGYLLARALFPDLDAAFALLLAAALAPTDAGLGAPTVLNPVVPVRIRRVLNVESGLNDGLATPVVLFAVAAIAGQEDLGPRASVSEALIEIVVGALLGAAAGAGVGAVITASRRRGWSVPAGRATAFLILPLAVYAAAQLVGGNGFIAAFVAGTATAAVARWVDEEESALGLTEVGADLLGSAIWFLFGLVVGPLVLPLSPESVVFAVAALTVLRLVPVALSLIGSGLRARSVLFIGWFGPRGLASLIFALIALESLSDDPRLRDVLATIGLTVMLSVVAHGLTAGPWAARYGAWVQAAAPPAETAAASEPRPRRGLARSASEVSR